MPGHAAGLMLLKDKSRHNTAQIRRSQGVHRLAGHPVAFGHFDNGSPPEMTSLIWTLR
jgi:hypothetical protein